jgi:tight adherence protein B
VTSWVVAGLLALAAVVVTWPVAGRASRRRLILGALTPGPPGRRKPGQVAAAVSRCRGRVLGPGRAAVWAVVVTGAALALASGGPVAALVAAGYGVPAGRAVLRRRERRTRTGRRAALLDTLSAAAADLRAGLPAAAALPDPGQGRPDPLVAKIRAATRLAEQTGAPLADVIERIEADARSADRARAAAGAQAAGSRATAWLLAGLPVGGLALGYAIGADPLAVLLHTPVGAACAIGAVTLQLAGLAWAARIVRPPAVAS